MISSDVPMGNASGPFSNATEAVQTAKMGAMRLLGDVARTALQDTLNAQMGNASGPDTNATEMTSAMMGAMRPLRHVEPSARRWKGDLPALMGDASRAGRNATESATAEMGGMKIHLSVAEDPQDQKRSKATATLIWTS